MEPPNLDCWARIYCLSWGDVGSNGVSVIVRLLKFAYWIFWTRVNLWISVNKVWNEESQTVILTKFKTRAENESDVDECAGCHLYGRLASFPGIYRSLALTLRSCIHLCVFATICLFSQDLPASLGWSTVHSNLPLSSLSGVGISGMNHTHSIFILFLSTNIHKQNTN